MQKQIKNFIEVQNPWQFQKILKAYFLNENRLYFDSTEVKHLIKY